MIPLIIISVIAFLISLWIIVASIYKKEVGILLILIPLVPVASLLLFAFSKENTSKEFENNGGVEIEGLNYLHKGTLDDKVCLATQSSSYNGYNAASKSSTAQIHKWNIIYCEEQGLGE